ncbi:cyclophilin-like fold protein [Campylobacter sp. CCS1377]|uniref:Cyclophilin-like fold protein n=1 Tax=Campylobacter sp. CCS1377 TaxID=3158229 RepID=A0AAU7E8Z6_9BACT|nr:cyclophilin-like fold protein [Campylobacter jejuni]
MKKILCFLLLLNTFLLGEQMQIQLLFNGKELRVILEDNEASKQFYNVLPMELEFSDFMKKEKIAHLPKVLNAKGSSAYKPQIGDLFYYVPWGNIGIFYELQNASNDLVYLGKVQGDLEALKAQKADFKMKIVKLK